MEMFNFENQCNSYITTYLTKVKKLNTKSTVEKALKKSYEQEDIPVKAYRNSLLSSMYTHKMTVAVITQSVVEGLVNTDPNRKVPIKYERKLHKSFIAHLTKDLGFKIHLLKSNRVRNTIAVIFLKPEMAEVFSTVTQEFQFLKLCKLLTIEGVIGYNANTGEVLMDYVKGHFTEEELEAIIARSDKEFEEQFSASEKAITAVVRQRCLSEGISISQDDLEMIVSCAIYLKSHPEEVADMLASHGSSETLDYYTPKAETKLVQDLAVLLHIKERCS